jgi:D-alanyl-D-alanine carboxypeptidase
MRIFITSFSLATLLFSNIFASGQTVSPALSELLQETLDSMHLVVPAKSLSAAIQFGDGAIWKSAVGISSSQPLVNVTTEDAYLMGSIVKTITSACVLQMHDEGLLSIEDTIGEWLPPMQYIDSGITIRQLLQHTSGLYDVMSNPNLQPALLADVNQIWQADDLISTFINPPLNSAGTNWSYCNTNYFLLGMIIEEVSGNPYYTELRNRFFEPLGLSTFGIPAFEAYNEPIAHVWMDIFGTGQTQDAHFFYNSYLSLNSVAGAAGGYYATPEDITKWMRTYMRGDLLQPETLADAQTTMTAPGLPAATYGLGLNRKTFSGYVGYGHGGDLAYSASSWYFPALDISITVCGNDADFISWELIPVVRELIETIDDSNLLSIEETVLYNQPNVYSVYPNPTSNQVIVEGLQSMKSWKLYSLDGRIVASFRGISYPSKCNIDMNEYAEGTYLLDVESINGDVETHRIIKTNG